MVEQLYVALGRSIRERREKINMTQEALAAQIGLSRTSVTNIERGRQAVYVHQLISLANALRLSPSALLETTKNVVENGVESHAAPGYAELLDIILSARRSGNA